MSKPSAHVCNPLPSLHPLVVSTSTTMAPRSTRPNSRANAPVTRKRGESDPNEPPKKRKTRQTKGGSDVEDDAELVPNAGKSGRRTKKGRYVLSSLFFFVFFYILLTDYYFDIEKLLGPKKSKYRRSRAVVGPFPGKYKPIRTPHLLLIQEIGPNAYLRRKARQLPLHIAYVPTYLPPKPKFFTAPGNESKTGLRLPRSP